MRRHCLIVALCAAYCAAAAPTTVPAPASQPTVTHQMLDLRIPDKVGVVTLSEQETCLTIQLDGHAVPVDQPLDMKLPSIHPQVWVLKQDGASVPQKTIKPASLGISNAGFTNEVMVFQFEKTPLSKIAGVVLSIDGKLYARELAAPTIQP